MRQKQKETKKVMLTVKASPERSKKYGETLCTAGITDTGEWIRLYPILYADMRKNPIKRYSWIEVECFRDPEHDKRKESYKIVPGTMRVVEEPRKVSNTNKPDWSYRNEIILPRLAKSIADLKEDGASLGLIKPVELLNFYLDPKKAKSVGYLSQDMQMLLTGEYIEPLLKNKNKIPHYSYTFTCGGCDNSCCTSTETHSFVCLDWELTASLVNWKKKYPDKYQYENKLKDKYFTYMKGRDLYFFVGTHHRYKTLMIIGLYYPPKEQNRSLSDFC